MSEFEAVLEYVDVFLSAADFLLVVCVQCVGGVANTSSHVQEEELEAGSLQVDQSATTSLLPPFGLRSEGARASGGGVAAGTLNHALVRLRSTRDGLAKKRKEQTGYTNLGAVVTFLFVRVPGAIAGPVLYYADTSSDVLLMLNLYSAGTGETAFWASLTVGFLALQYLGAWVGVLFYFYGTHGISKEEFKMSKPVDINFLAQYYKSSGAAALLVLGIVCLSSLGLGWQLAAVIFSSGSWIVFTVLMIVSSLLVFIPMNFVLSNPLWFTLFIGPILVLQLSFWSAHVAFPEWLFYKGFVWYGLIFIPVPLTLDIIMFLEPLDLLWMVPSTQLQALVPAYKGTRTLLEVNFEGLPQSILQIYIYVRVTSGGAENHGGALDGVDQTVLVRSLTLSLLAFFKSWTENILSARSRGYLKNECSSGMLAYLKDQLRMGAGLPMNAIESGQITEWKSPFQPTSVAQLEVLFAVLNRDNATLTKLDLSGGAIDAEGILVLAQKLSSNARLTSLKYASAHNCLTRVSAR